MHVHRIVIVVGNCSFSSNCDNPSTVLESMTNGVLACLLWTMKGIV